MKILAIETSCDETSLAIIETSGSKARLTFRVLSHIVSSQIELHAQFGGVVPNLAKREHQRLLVPLLIKVLKQAGMETNAKHVISNAMSRDLAALLEREPDLLASMNKKIGSLAAPDIDAIAVTNGPGLAPALWVGINFAKALALIWNKPIIPMNHMKGHLYAAFIHEKVKLGEEISFPVVRFPMITLLVSGGHTELVLMNKWGNYEIIGATLDDAVGEAFDKVARMMKLGYPGGPAISKIAKEYTLSKPRFSLPRPMMSSKDYNFSFSGLKTAVLYALRDVPKGKKTTVAMAKEFQDAAVDVLVAKTMRAAKQYGARTITVGGGVSANQLLRTRLQGEVAKIDAVDLFLPDRSVTGDNALMIALAAAIDGKKKAPKLIGADANMQIDD